MTLLDAVIPGDTIIHKLTNVRCKVKTIELRLKSKHGLYVMRIARNYQLFRLCGKLCR